MKTPSHIIFNIAGGLGKNIMATAVVRALDKAYPDARITVTTPHRDVWLHNPRVDEIVDVTATPDFYTTYIHDPDDTRLILRLDPYMTADHMYRRAHLTEIWCRLCGVPWDGPKPELYFTARERSMVKKVLAPTKKPIFLIQTSGGAAQQPYPISWARDISIPFAEQIVEHMSARGYRTIHLRRADQPALTGTEYITLSHRQALIAVTLSTARLFMDSFAHHTAAAFELPSTVLWMSNSPTVFGYAAHDNMLCKAPEMFRHRLDMSPDGYDILGRPEEYPYETSMDELFDADRVIDSLTEHTAYMDKDLLAS